MDKKESVRNSTCEEQINMAGRELSAFIRAVAELCGPEQARLSTEDWLDESELMDSPPRATSRDWRAVTVAASARLANRGTLARDHRTLAKLRDTETRHDIFVDERLRSSMRTWETLSAPVYWVEARR
jgi:hypothetical protein